MPASFTCPDCGATSQHPKDVQFSYCGHCHQFKDDDTDEVPDGPWRDDRLWVLSDKCGTCIFRPGNLMMLDPGRVRDMVDACLTYDTVIPCHQTLHGPRSICRGFYDSYGDRTPSMQMAGRLGVIAFDDPSRERT